MRGLLVRKSLFSYILVDSAQVLAFTLTNAAPNFIKHRRMAPESNHLFEISRVDNLTLTVLYACRQE